MNENIVQEILHELFSSLEALDTQTTAILQFLKDKGIANEEELARHLEEAGNASNVRWRGVRVRIDYLLSSAMKAAEQDAQKESSKTAENSQETPRNKGTETSRSKEPEKEVKKDAPDKQHADSPAQTEAEEVDASVDKDRTQPGNDKDKNKEKDNNRDDRHRTAQNDREDAA